MPDLEVAGANFVITIQKFSIATEGFGVAALKQKFRD